MKKSFVILMMFLILLIPTIGHGVGSSIEISTDIDLSQLQPGDNFTVTINVGNVTNFVGGEIVLNYDPALLRLVTKNFDGVNMTDFTSLEGVTNNNLVDDPGKILFLFGLNKGVDPLSTNQVIGTLTFEAISKGTGSVLVDNSSRLIAEDIDGGFNEIPYNSTVLEYNILRVGSLSGSIKDKEGSPLDVVSIELMKDDVVIYSGLTSSDGIFSIEKIIEGSYTLIVSRNGYKEYSETVTITSEINTVYNLTLSPIVLGDVTGDDIVSLEDLVYVANYFGLALGNDNWSDNASIADVNKDGKVDILDLIFVNRRLSY